ncbi:MAG: SusC/RagA family TonB-linked outer membrane protein [Bacteroidota bacterium]|nr:SusC/RagA family TonB-linked outer membrane protein [Bacteroidota bacterium]
MNRIRTRGFKTGSSHSLLIIASLFLFATMSLQAQVIPPAAHQEGTITVSGQVRDAHTKKPIAAAQVQALNNVASATTDENGHFSIHLFRDDEVLFVSAFDYSKREIPVRGNKSVVIDLYPETFRDFYSKQDLLTGSVRNSCTLPSAQTVTDFTLSQAISADEFVQSELGGNVRSISRSGVTGMGSSMFIRGYNSLSANAQPLYVIDGIILNNLYDVASLFDGHYANPLTNIDINDIQSISVLKDGTSIYGSKAANGVILIKTNRGKSQVTKINVNLMSGLTTTPNSIPVMNASQYRIYASDLIGTAGYTNKEIENMNFLQEDKSLSFYNQYHNQTDWSKEVYQNGATKSYSINVNGGDEKALYYFSLGYTGNDGIVKSTDMTRINTRFNADFNLLKELKLGLNISYTNLNNTLLDDGVNFYTSPTYLSLIKSPFLSAHTYTSTGVITADFADADELGIGNPAGVIDNSLNYTRSHYFDFSLLPVWKINQDLTFSSQVNYNLNKYEENYYSPIVGVATQYLEGYGYSENMIQYQVVRNIALFNDSRLRYEKLFNGVHQLSAMLGWRYLNNYFESDFTECHNTNSDNNTFIKKSYDYLQVSGVNNHTNSLSNYASVDYNYANRYFLSGAVSIDGSSRFGKETESGFQLFDHSWGVFPSINGAWLASSERFMKNVDFINLLKIRLGYGITGNDGIEDYANRAYFTSIRYLGFANGTILSNVANNHIQWETTGRANAGIDLGLFDEKLNVSMDVYTSRTKNLLTWKNLGDLAGLNAYLTNAGELSNKGFEFSANLKLLNLKRLQWEVGMTAGHYKNNIESLPEGDIITNVYDGQVLSRVGQPAGVFYGFKTKGVFATEADAATANLSVLNNDGTYSKFSAGDVIFDDYKKDGVIDDNDRQIIGDPNPSVYGSFTSKISYKKLTFSALFNYSYGNDVYNYLRSQLEAGSNLSNQSTAMLSRWTAEGQVTNQPKAVFGDPMGNARFSDRWIEDGSFLRLKTLSLSYTIPVNSTMISGLEVWVAANNLYTWTKYLGADPEFSCSNAVLYQGIDAGLVPQTQSFFMGLKISL